MVFLLLMSQLIHYYYQTMLKEKDTLVTNRVNVFQIIYINRYYCNFIDRYPPSVILTFFFKKKEQ